MASPVVKRNEELYRSRIVCQTYLLNLSKRKLGTKTPISKRTRRKAPTTNTPGDVEMKSASKMGTRGPSSAKRRKTEAHSPGKYMVDGSATEREVDEEMAASPPALPLPALEKPVDDDQKAPACRSIAGLSTVS